MTSQVPGGRRIRERGAERHPLELLSHPEQVHHRRVLLGWQQLRLHVQPEQPGPQPPLLGNLPRPGRPRDVAGDHISRGRGGPSPGQGEQLLPLVGGRGYRRDEVMRRPGLPGQGFVRQLGPGHQRRQRLGERAHRGDLPGSEHGQVGTEAHQGDADGAGPAVGHQFHRHRRQHRPHPV